MNALKQISVELKTNNLGDLCSLCQIPDVNATFLDADGDENPDGRFALVTCGAAQLDEVIDALESDDNVDSYTVAK